MILHYYRLAGSMALYELAIFDPSDPVLNPMWRQGMHVMPFMSRLGITSSWNGWDITGATGVDPGFWSFEGVAAAHIVFSGLLMLASIWHWTYGDLDLGRFENRRACSRPSKNFWNSSSFSWTDMFWIWAFHCANVGIAWDPYGLSGHVEPVALSWGVEGFNPFNPGGIVANHIAAGLWV